MSAEMLLKHFSRISEVPDSVPRLRRFILDLAVRGKLVEQYPGDEPASSLLEGIRKLAGSASLSKTPPDGCFPLPHGWSWSDIGSITTKTGSGSTPRGGQSAYQASGIPFLRSQNIYNNGLRLNEVAYIDDATHRRMRGTAVEPGDLLLNITGGSIGRCCRISDDPIQANISQHVAIIRVAFAEMRDFVHKVVLSPFFQSFVTDEQTGAGRGGLPKNRMDRIPIALPPLKEQHRIVTKINELMSLCDQLEDVRTEREEWRDRLVTASLNRISTETATPKEIDSHLNHLPRLTTRPEHLRQLRKVVLNLSVHGRLVAQDLTDESTDDLLNVIHQDQREAIRHGHLKKRPSTDKSSCKGLFSIPSQWRWVKLGDLITFGPQNGISPKETKDIQAPKALTLTATTSGFFNGSHYKHVELSECECENYWLSAGDVLFQRGNTREYVGIAAIFDGPAESFVSPDLMIRVRFSKHLDLRFVHTVLISPPLREYFSSGATGASTTMPKINQALLLNAPIPVPPLTEQRRIVAKVDELMLLCNQLEDQLATTEADSRRFVEAVLSDARQS